MKAVIKATAKKLGGKLFRSAANKKLPPDIDEAAANTILLVNPAEKLYTQTSVERVYGLIEAVRYLEAAQIPGAFVECGVWRGGSMMAVAQTLIQLNRTQRQLMLFDTFEGMNAPTADDVTFDGRPAADKFSQTQRSKNSSSWCYASLEDVKNNLSLTSYPAERIQYIKGMVEDTIPAHAPAQIALLRLDTDWYESTRHELVHLYDRLAIGGVLIIDDYGHWRGSRKAVDEFLAERKIPLLLNRLDYSGRIAVKLN